MAPAHLPKSEQETLPDLIILEDRLSAIPTRQVVNRPRILMSERPRHGENSSNSSVRLDGTTACMTVAGAANTEVFRAYVPGILVPTLREGDLVVMDNLGAHINALTVALIESAGAKAVFLPAYSPDHNPIEMMWSKVKAILRSLEARDNESLLAGSCSKAVRAKCPAPEDGKTFHAGISPLHWLRT